MTPYDENSREIDNRVATLINVLQAPEAGKCLSVNAIYKSENFQ